jgi:hypothetical protein
MRYSIVRLAVIAVFVSVAAIVRAQETPVPPAKIPKKVMDALLAKFPKAKIDKCIKEKEGDDVVYDIEFIHERRKCEADIRENGTYINYEKAIEAKDLPKAVRAAVEMNYPQHMLKEIMEETEVKGKAEKLVAYEVVLMAADKKEMELKLSLDGKILEEAATEQQDALK